MEITSKDVSWRWLTTAAKLETGKCELLYASLAVSAASTDTHLYDGTSTSGEQIVTLESNNKRNLEFRPPVPVYCSMGLYVDVGTNVTGVLVMWRKL